VPPFRTVTFTQKNVEVSFESIYGTFPTKDSLSFLISTQSPLDLLNSFKSLLCADITSPIPSSHSYIIRTSQFKMSQSVTAFVASLEVPATTASQLITQIQANPAISNLTSSTITPIPALLPLTCWVLNIILASGEVTFPPADQALVEVNWYAHRSQTSKCRHKLIVTKV
jgi:hypothetical protein